MAFEPIRMTSPNGVTVLVGSAVEREHLIVRGYRLVEDAKPAAKPEPKPAAKRAEPDAKK